LFDKLDLRNLRAFAFHDIKRVFSGGEIPVLAGTALTAFWPLARAMSPAARLE
jgi:hypothetical protein